MTSKQEAWWERVQSALEGAPLGELPKWMPRGELPHLDDVQLRELGGGGFSVVVVNDLTDIPEGMVE